MKKLLVLIMAIAMTLSVAACGGTASETEFVSMDLGNITMSVPSVFTAVTEQDGMYATAGPDSSIVVTPTLEVELQPSEWDESLAAETLEMLYGGTFTDMELTAFEGDVNMNGNTAVYYAFNGKNSEDKERLVQIVRLYNFDLTEQYVITFLHSADDEFFTPEIDGNIINSITLSPEA